MNTSDMLSDTWENTSVEIMAISYEMDVIHERYGGKENRAEREELLNPLRKKCIAIGERRHALINKTAQKPAMKIGGTARQSNINWTMIAKWWESDRKEFEEDFAHLKEIIKAMIATALKAKVEPAQPAIVAIALVQDALRRCETTVQFPHFGAMRELIAKAGGGQ